MATRVISTKLAIQGESEFKAAITKINAEMKTMNAQLKLTQSEYQNNANSMEALTAKGENLRKLQEAQTAKLSEIQKALDAANEAQARYTDEGQKLRERLTENQEALDELSPEIVEAGEAWAEHATKAEECEKKLAKLETASGDTSKEQEQLEKQLQEARAAMERLEQETDGAAVTAASLTTESKELSDGLKTNEQYLEAAKKGANSWEEQLYTTQTKLNNLNAEIQLNDKYMKEAEDSADGCATSIDEYGKKTEEATDSASELRDVLAAAGVIEALKKTAEALIACVEASIAFESAMAGVAKTTDLTDEELADMADAIQKMATEIPATATEIAEVVESAGQLGIAKDSLLDFAEVMVNLGVATNLSSTEAASALAKFANITKMSADDYGRLGSVIVALGNNFATTEADIVNMASNLAATGELVGLSEAQMMSIAATLSSLGIEAQAGGTAISKLLKQFEVMVATESESLSDFAAVAGMSAEEFSIAWGEDAVGALAAFINGLGDVDAAGGSSVAVLEELGLTETRLSNAVLAMASSEDLLTQAVTLGNKAWEENTALATEAETRYATTESKLAMLSNAAENVKTTVGDQLTPALGTMADVGTEVLNWAADFVEDNERLVPIITAAATAIAVLAAAVAGYTIVQKVATVAAQMFTAVLDTNPIFLAISAVAALAAGLAVLTATAEDTVPSLSELTEAADALTEATDTAAKTRETTVETTEAAAAVADSYITKLEELEETGLKTDEQQQEYHNTLVMLCSVVPELAGYIDLENDAIQGGTKALRDNTEAWKQNAIQQAIQEEYTAVMEAYADTLIEAQKNQNALTVAEEEAGTAKQNYLDAQQRVTDAYEEAAEKARQVNEETGLTTSAVDYLGAEYDQLVQEMNDAGNAWEDAQEVADRYAEAVDADSTALENAQTAIDETTKILDPLTKAQEDAAAAAQAEADALAEQQDKIESIQGMIDDLATAYNEAYTAAESSINGQIGLFGEFSTELGEDLDSVKEMLDRWAKQTENLNKYTENLKKAAEYGLDDGLVKSLSDGSSESAAYLQTIIDQVEELGGSLENGLSTDAKDLIKEINTAYEDTQTAVSEYAATVAEIKTSFDETIAAIETAAAEADFTGLHDALTTAFEGLPVELEGIGENAAKGYVQGVTKDTAAVAIAGENVANVLRDHVMVALDEHSPSKVMEEIGENADLGLAQGVTDGTETVVEAATELGGAVTEAMEVAAGDAVGRYTDVFSGISAKTRAAIRSLKVTISEATSDMPENMYELGKRMTNRLIEGLKSRSGELYTTVADMLAVAVQTASGSDTTVNNTYGDTSVQIYQQAGEDSEELAYRVADMLKTEIDRKAAALQ